MTVRDLIEQTVDMDVIDDVCEELWIAFCGPMELTEEGKKKFADVLDYPVMLIYDHAIVSVDGPDWEDRLEKAKEFFESMAGYCTVDEYKKWFMEGR